MRREYLRALNEGRSKQRVFFLSTFHIMSSNSPSLSHVLSFFVFLSFFLYLLLFIWHKVPIGPRSGAPPWSSRSTGRKQLTEYEKSKFQLVDGEGAPVPAPARKAALKASATPSRSEMASFLDQVLHESLLDTCCFFFFFFFFPPPLICSRQTAATRTRSWTRFSSLRKSCWPTARSAPCSSRASNSWNAGAAVYSYFFLLLFSSSPSSSSSSSSFNSLRPSAKSGRCAK